MARKQFIRVEDRTPYGEDFDEKILHDAAIDSTYIEGYSDVRTQRELDVRAGKKVDPLRHRLQWVRAKSTDNTADGRRPQHWSSRKGYRPLSYDEAIKLGYRVDKNMAISKGADGNAYLADCMLMFCDAPVAAANLKRVQQDAVDLQERPQRAMEEAVERFNRAAHGATATSFSQVGDEPERESKKKK